MSIKVVMVFKEISQKQFSIIICKFVLNFNKALVWMKDKLF